MSNDRPSDCSQGAAGASGGEGVMPREGSDRPGAPPDTAPDTSANATTVPIAVPVGDDEWRRLKEEADRPSDSERQKDSRR